MKIQMMLVVGMLALSTSIMAQQPTVNSPAYHSIHNPQSPYYVGPKHQSPQQQQPPGYWEKTWGAIATSESGGALGTAVGVSSKAQAERIAMQDCQAKGGVGCKIDLSYHNQCAVMLIGDGIALARAASIEEAKADGMKACEEKGDKCRIYYSACTEPIFRHY